MMHLYMTCICGVLSTKSIVTLFVSDCQRDNETCCPIIKLAAAGCNDNDT